MASIAMPGRALVVFTKVRLENLYPAAKRGVPVKVKFRCGEAPAQTRAQIPNSDGSVEWTETVNLVVRDVNNAINANVVEEWSPGHWRKIPNFRILGRLTSELENPWQHLSTSADAPSFLAEVTVHPDDDGQQERGPVAWHAASGAAGGGVGGGGVGGRRGGGGGGGRINPTPEYIGGVGGRRGGGGGGGRINPTPEYIGGGVALPMAAGMAGSMQFGGIPTALAFGSLGGSAPSTGHDHRRGGSDPYTGLTAPTAPVMGRKQSSFLRKDSSGFLRRESSSSSHHGRRRSSSSFHSPQSEEFPAREVSPPVRLDLLPPPEGHYSGSRLLDDYAPFEENREDYETFGTPPEYDPWLTRALSTLDMRESEEGHLEEVKSERFTHTFSDASHPSYIPSVVSLAAKTPASAKKKSMFAKVRKFPRGRKKNKRKGSLSSAGITAGAQQSPIPTSFDDTPPMAVETGTRREHVATQAATQGRPGPELAALMQGTGGIVAHRSPSPPPPPPRQEVHSLAEHEPTLSTKLSPRASGASGASGRRRAALRDHIPEQEPRLRHMMRPQETEAPTPYVLSAHPIDDRWGDERWGDERSASPRGPPPPYHEVAQHRRRLTAGLIHGKDDSVLEFMEDDSVLEFMEDDSVLGFMEDDEDPDGTGYAAGSILRPDMLSLDPYSKIPRDTLGAGVEGSLKEGKPTGCDLTPRSVTQATTADRNPSIDVDNREGRARAVAGQKDSVYFSCFSPPEVSEKVSFTLRVSAYLRNYRDDVLGAAQSVGLERGLPLTMSVQRQRQMSVVLDLPEDVFEVIDPGADSTPNHPTNRRDFSWTGAMENVDFGVRCKPGAPLGIASCTASIAEGTTVRDLSFSIEVVEPGGALLLQQQQKREWGFPGYVSEDVAVIQKKDLHTEGFLGSGVQGDTYAGVWKGKRVAIKCLRECPASWTARRSRSEIEHEATILSLLGRHRNIVEFYGLCWDAAANGDNDTVMMVTKREVGGSLVEVLGLERNGSATANGNGRRFNSTYFSGQVRVGWAKDVARGLAHSHAAGVVHNDVATRNTLLSAGGVDGDALLCDFGISTLLRGNGLEAVHMLDANNRWPVAQMPPEALYEPHVLSRSSDSWMYGIMLYELFEGKPLFAGLKRNEVMCLVGEGKKLETPEMLEEQGPAVVKVFESCLSKNWESRMTMKDIVATL